MKLTNQSNIGWLILNGSGWNRHRTAETLEAMSSLPEIPVGYGVLVAPISDKPFGLRCALVKVQARKTDIIDGAEYDDGPADHAGETDQWAYDKFGVEVERIYSCKAEQQSDDDSAYFIEKIAEALKKM